MKHFKHLLFTTGLFISSLMMGQTHQLDVGIEGGIGLSSLRGEGLIVDFDSRMGFSTGVSIQYHLNESFALKTSVLYERKGSKLEDVMFKNDVDDPHGVLSDWYEELNYITVPILAKYSFGGQKNFYVNAGPFVSYLLDAYTVIKPDHTLPRVEVENTEFHNRTDFGLAAGIGGQINLNENIVLSVELRNNLGFATVKDEGEFKTNSTNIMFGVAYSLLGKNNTDDME